jgi:PemK-like, MazF-like toxin of type II toxin-antitoxin system
MNVRRGDVVLVFYPFASGRGASRRPALIVQNHRYIRRLDKTIIAHITTTVRRAYEPTHGQPSGSASCPSWLRYTPWSPRPRRTPRSTYGPSMPWPVA